MAFDDDFSWKQAHQDMYDEYEGLRSLQWNELDEEQRDAAARILKKTQPSAKKEQVRVFISLCEGIDLDLSLVRDLIDPFLTSLGFDVHYYNKDISFGIPNDQIYSIMDSCDIIVALYSKRFGNDETGYTAAENVIKEVNRDRPRDKFIFYEKGVDLGSMTYSEVPCLPFTRDEYANLLLHLVQVLVNSKSYEIKASRK